MPKLEIIISDNYFGKYYNKGEILEAPSAHFFGWAIDNGKAKPAGEKAKVPKVTKKKKYSRKDMRAKK